MKPVRDNAITIVFLVLMLLAIIGQAFAGLALERSEMVEHQGLVPGMWDYMTSSSFGVDLLENWQSEFMQFTLFIALTVWLAQRGSAEAKAPGDAGREHDEHSRRANLWQRHSLLVVMAGLFLLTWAGQAFTGWRNFNEEQSAHGSPGVSLATYVGDPEFWARTFQNWQSEFLAVAAMAIFTVYLREWGSPESKRLEAPASANDPTY